MIKEVAEQLGNTPTVCRSAYVDPRIIDAYFEGAVIDLIERGSEDEMRRRTEAAVLSLLRGDRAMRAAA